MSETDRQKWNRRYRGGAYSGHTNPSAMLQEWIERVPPGRALDLACGAGRNSLYLARRGFEVDAVDISGAALERARASAQAQDLSINWLECDLDEPLALETTYQLILVVHYVNLPRIRRVAASLAPGGFLVCEEHMVTDEDVTGPTNPAYRVTCSDLLEVAGGLRVHYLEEVLVPESDGLKAALVRLVASRSD